MKTITYSEHEQCFIKVVEPDKITQNVVVILIHGGYWRMEKTLETVADAQSFFVEAGYIVCNVEYRRGPENPWPIPSNDVKEAIKKIKARFPNNHYALIGHSVGGQLALLNAEASDYVITLAPVTDLIYTRDMRLGDEAVQEYFGEEIDDSVLVSASPISQLPLKADAALIIHGANDVRVDIKTTIDYFQENLKHKNNIELLILPKMAHQDIIHPAEPHFSYLLNWLDTIV